jgi:hypothetical protein
MVLEGCGPDAAACPSAPGYQQSMRKRPFVKAADFIELSANVQF